MFYKYFAALLLLTITVTACSDKKKNKSPAVSIEYSDENGVITYTMTQFGCSTGQQVFSSQIEMCNGLLDDTRNKNCARDLRDAFHTDVCVNGHSPFETIEGAGGSASNGLPHEEADDMSIDFNFDLNEN